MNNKQEQQFAREFFTFEGEEISNAQYEDVMTLLIDQDPIEQVRVLTYLEQIDGISYTNFYTSLEIRIAHDICHDERYNNGNMTGAIDAIEAIAIGLSNHPQVQKVLFITQVLEQE
ncbi:MAG TPA: hypothetical protein EYQ21_02425 [Flavobacteriales bacterium]|nr:hypothetical protein [Flavobacteriales bacterium]